MRKKFIGIIGAIAVASLVSSVTCTPVFAGITKGKMEEDDAVRINDGLSGVTIGNFDDAFATLSTVATKTGAYDADRNYYAVTNNFPLKYRMYFNEYIDGNSGDKHSLIWGTLVYKISPSGGEITDDTKWPFPQLKEAADNENRTELQNFINTNITDIYHDQSTSPTVRSAGNMPTSTADAKKGILTWRDGINLPQHNVYGQYQNDAGSSYYTSQLEINNIVGSPGDKLEVKIYHYTNNQGNVTLQYGLLPTLDYGSVINVNPGDVTLQGGVKVVSGYIYIPYTLTYDSNGGGTAPTADEYYTCDDKTVTVLGQGSMAKSDNQFLGWSESQTSLITDVANIPTDLKKAGSTFDITDDMTLYAVWADKDLVINDIKVPIYKRVVQNGEGTLPDMTFNFTFEQKSEWEGVSYVSTATQIGDKSVTIRESDRYTGNDDPYVGDLTGKKLYYGKYDNILSDFNPQTAGTYLYLVKESIPDPALPNVTYTGSEYVLKVEVDSNKEIVNIPTITLYKDSAGKKKTDYTTPPRVFDEKHELIFYNTYGTNGGTTPTGLMTNILPFIIIGGAGVGGLTLYVMYNVKRKKKENY